MRPGAAIGLFFLREDCQLSSSGASMVALDQSRDGSSMHFFAAMVNFISEGIDMHLAKRLLRHQSSSSGDSRIRDMQKYA